MRENMQADLPDDPQLRETMASLGPGAKDATLGDLAVWIRELEVLCDSQDAALAPASFRTDISGSCLSTVPDAGNTLSSAAQVTELQTKAVNGCPPLSELRIEKVSSNKKNGRGEAKLRLSVERGPVLVLLTITDLHGVTRTLRAVTVDDNDLIPVRHSSTAVEATAIPVAPELLLERLRLVESKIKEQHEQKVQPNASHQRRKEKASAQRQADGVNYVKKRTGGQVMEQIFDPETGTITAKSSGCSNPHCDGANCTAAPFTMTWNVHTGETAFTTDGPQMNAILGPMLQSFQGNRQRQVDLCKRADAILKEEKEIKEKMLTAKPGEKKRLGKELEKTAAEFGKLKDLMLRTAGTSGWLGAPKEEIRPTFEKAKRKDPDRVEVLRLRAIAALEESIAIEERLEHASSQSRKKQLSRLLARKEIELDEAMNAIAVIADDGEPEEESEELDEFSVCMDEAPLHISMPVIFALAFALVLALSIAYIQLS
ncbi:hypothetical protein AAVH_20317 [Aphelenchoides avenae]|nr:hypothetical protein AAVH_20317 [Aphelenchus avenae]